MHLITACRAAILLVFLSLVPAPAMAADIPGAGNGGLGSVVGRVQNRTTGKFLHNARVSIKGTTAVVYTDAFGAYRFPAVPSGPVVLEVFYTDLDSQDVAVVIAPGGRLEQDVTLTSRSRYGADTGPINLNPYVVAQDRETDGKAIAINEQRFAPNIKNVMSTDSLGDVLSSSVGEFLKFMPGITAEYDNADIAAISVRGIGSGMTAVSVDGAPFTSNGGGSATRSADIRTMALNDISRIEVTKVPTPANPADSLGGSVNMIGKSAFERSRREFRFGLNFVGNHENIAAKRTPHSFLDRKTYKIFPGANFDFSWPLSKTFGVVVAGLHTEKFNEQHISTQNWATSGTGINASLERPFLQSYQLIDGPRNHIRSSLSVKADWKVAPHSVISFGHTVNRTNTEIGTLVLLFNAGNNGTPAVVSGVPMTWDPGATRGAAGRGTITNNGTNQLFNQITDTSSLNFRFYDGRWRLEAGLSRIWSGTKRRYDDIGTFTSAAATNNRPVRVNFLQISPDRPAIIEAFDNNSQVFDWRDLGNYRGTTAQIGTGPSTWANRGQFTNGYFNLRRRCDFLSFPAAVQVGGSQRVQTSDVTRYSINWTFNGPDGNSGATAPVSPYGMQVYRNVDSGFGFSGIQWMSPTRAYQAWQQNPRLYAKTAAQLFAEENSRIDNSEYIKEVVQAAYIQAETEFPRQRLFFLAGVRFERTTDDGQGAHTDADAVWQRDSNGNYLRTAAGARIRRPEAGAVNSLEQILLTRKERGARTHRVYHGYYPSLHATFRAADEFLVRGAYARTYGRPNFGDIIPRTVATNADLDDDDTPDPVSGRGTLSIRNSALKPWTADNFDLSLEYYSQQGGLVSAGVFLKEIRDFFGTAARIASAGDIAALEIDPRYVGWNIITKFNAGDARITGAEFNIRQSLRGLGRWGSYFTLFVNATKLQLSGNPGASFTSFIPKSGNWGATFSRQRFQITARWNYRGLDRRAPVAAFGPDGYEYFDARVTLDLNASFQLNKYLSVHAGANNLTNSPQVLLRYGGSTPAYARQYQKSEFGVQWAVGINGSF
ncbi:MAG: TonB-dependent receptor [Opitutaceae bacterium]|nr:TonB-dependent receptor [Opitutaceae bacterium]